MYSKFPREIGIPHRISTEPTKQFVENIQQFKQIVNTYYKFNNLYTSIYGFKSFHKVESIERQFNGSSPLPNGTVKYKINYESAFIDKIFFDFDPNEEKNITLEDSFNQTLNLHNYLLQKDILHCVNFSGDGFHLFIFTKNGEQLVLKRDALTNAQNHFVTKLNLTSFDTQIQDNVSRLCRIVNTHNFRIGRWCIPLTSKYLHEGMLDEIIKLSQHQFYEFEFFGHNQYDILQWDAQTPITQEQQTFVNVGRSYTEHLINIKVPECVQKLVNKGKRGEHLNWNERYIIILWYRENNCIYEELLDFITETFLGRNSHGVSDSFHCINEEKQSYYVYRNDEYTFPSCNRIRRLGICRTVCTMREKLYYNPYV